MDRDGFEREGRRRGYEALLVRAEGNATAMAMLARLMLSDGLDREAIELACRARDLAADDAQVRVLAAETLSARVPRWHFYMLKDAVRNGAYEAALRRVITPESRVLEIGCGSGLLAMMAARAGARHVYTCEAVPAIAHAAREIVARNGFADRITVLDGHSSSLSPGDCGGPADVLVSEIVSNNLLGEEVLAATTDAVGRLVRPGAAIIPAAGSVRVALACDRRREKRRLGMVDGFDLSPFNRLAQPHYRVAVDSPALDLCSDPATLLHFDFTGGGPWRPGAASVDLMAREAVPNGVVQWIALELNAVDRYENRPGTMPMSAWAPVFHPFDTADGACAGAWRVHARHEAAALRLWAEPLDVPADARDPATRTVHSMAD